MSNAIDDMHTELVRLRAQNAKMLAMLRRSFSAFGDCIGCNQWSDDGTHEPDCELAALLKERGGE